MNNEYTWEDVVKECEDILQMNGHAKSPLQSNLPNAIRDLVFKITGSPIASQPIQSSRQDSRPDDSEPGEQISAVTIGGSKLPPCR